MSKRIAPIEHIPYRTLQLFLVALAALPLAVSAQQQEPPPLELQIGSPSPVGFNTVKEAREKLLRDESLKRRTDDDGWIQLHDRDRNVLWSFVPEDRDAYPSVIRRSVATGSMGRRINMDALCEAPHKACKALMQHLKRENAIANNQFDRMPHGGLGVNSDDTPLGSLMSAAP